jgi:hypothetical protein
VDLVVTMPRWAPVACAALVAGLLLMPVSHADETQLLANLASDFADATSVFVGIVMRSTPALGRDDVITSSVVVRRSRTLKGPTTPREVTIAIPGGTVGTITMHTSEVPLLKVGDRILILLDDQGVRLPGTTLFTITGSAEDLNETSITMADVEALLE